MDLLSLIVILACLDQFVSTVVEYADILNSDFEKNRNVYVTPEVHM